MLGLLIYFFVKGWTEESTVEVVCLSPSEDPHLHVPPENRSKVAILNVGSATQSNVCDWIGTKN